MAFDRINLFALILVQLVWFSFLDFFTPAFCILFHFAEARRKRICKIPWTARLKPGPFKALAIWKL